MQAPALDKPVLDLVGVTKVYAGPPPVTALAGIDLTVRSGELVVIVGPSGSGKSTLLNVMGGLDRATSGSVAISGHDLADLNDRDLSGIRAVMMGFVFQEFFLMAGTSALDNVAEGLRYRGIPRRDRHEQAAHALGQVGLDHRKDHLPTQLSGGERQRVAIARALVGDPAVVFADEPTGNLDSATGADIIDLLEDLNRSGATIVVITHNPEVAFRFPRTVEIRDGVVVGDPT
jgi:putative ABC transport system ATP-binding protein